MGLERTAFKGASWLALFKLITQIFSWASTVIIARILTPADYGLMELATIVTGYAVFFYELGIGAAIIQKQEIIQRDLTSVFWFSLFVSILLAIICFFSAYFFAYIVHEPRIIPMIHAISLIFPLSAMQIVPMSLLLRDFHFKRIGFIEMIGVFVSCSAMLLIARNGGGVWTLVGGSIVLSLTKFFMVYNYARWSPRFHFSFAEVKSYLTFGMMVFTGRSFFYISDKSDKFFAGRAWSPLTLGYYSFALQLAQLPTEKITVLINQVSFPVFSKLQNKKEEFASFYLKVINMTATLVMPIFTGGFLVGEDMIKILLNDKWFPIIPLFKYLCLTQIFTSLNAANSFVHYSLGRPNLSMYYHGTCAFLMTISFYIAVQYGLNAILIPWFTTYIIICIAWTVITVNTMGISVFKYIRNLMNPLLATFSVFIAITLFSSYIFLPLNIISMLAIKVMLGLVVYVCYFIYFDRQIFQRIKNLRNL